MRAVTTSLCLVIACSGLAACSDEAKKRPLGEPCGSGVDCEDDICHVGVCASKNPLKDGEACTLDAQCRSFNCKNGFCAPGLRGLGDACRFNVECLSGICRIEGSLPGLCVKDSSPDGAVPDSAPPDAGPDQALPDQALPDKALPDKALPDKALPDKALADKALPDQPWPDQQWPDAPLPDYGPCGDKNQACCGSLCNPPLTCISNKCVCGAKGQPCCTGDVCDANLTCDSKTKTCACGALLQPCCGGTTCGSSLYCTGKACACLKVLDGDLYIRTDGTVWNNYGGGAQPVQISGPLLQNATQILAGGSHGCALRADGTVWCFGRSTNSDTSGQLGDGTIGGATTGYNATQVKTATGNLTGVVNISGTGSGGWGCSTTCAVKSDGTVWCWGADHSGGGYGYGLFQKINDTAKPVATQIKASASTMLTGAKQVAVRNMHACAVVGNNAACWGYNGNGRLGAGNTNQHQYPQLVTISGKAIKRVSTGFNNTCALTTTGEVYCWGANGFGQCGLGYTSASVTGPAQVSQAGGGYLTGVKAIAVGYSLTCAIKTADSTLWCWGNKVGNKATKMLDSSSNPIEAALITGDRTVPDYRVLRTSGEYYRASSKYSYSCP
jgi:Regulator of chromosome condensation (RCC1) repeat